MQEAEYFERTDRIKHSLFRIAVLQLGSESMALDAVDEAVYKGYRARGKLREPQYFSTWLTRILLNECSAVRRKNKRYMPQEAAENLLAPEDFDSLALKEAIRLLPEKLRHIIILRYFEGYTLKDTASLLEIPQGTAATRQRKALALLRLNLIDTEDDL